MKDMLMSTTGDLILIEDNSMENKVKLNFIISKTKPVQLSFSFEENNDKLEKHSIKLSFEFINSPKKYKEKIIQDEKVLNQLLNIALNTPINSLSHDLSFGNELELYKHCQIRDTKNTSLISKCIEKALKSILSDFTVVVSYDKNKQIGESTQTISAKIETSEKTFLKDVEV